MSPSQTTMPFAAIERAIDEIRQGRIYTLSGVDQTKATIGFFHENVLLRRVNVSGRELRLCGGGNPRGAIGPGTDGIAFRLSKLELGFTERAGIERLGGNNLIVISLRHLSLLSAFVTALIHFGEGGDQRSGTDRQPRVREYTPRRPAPVPSRFHQRRSVCVKRSLHLRQS